MNSDTIYTLEQTLVMCVNHASKMILGEEKGIREAMENAIKIGEKLKISVSFTVDPKQIGTYDLESVISYTNKKTKKKMTARIEELQVNMFKESAGVGAGVEIENEENLHEDDLTEGSDDVPTGIEDDEEQDYTP